MLGNDEGMAAGWENRNRETTAAEKVLDRGFHVTSKWRRSTRNEEDGSVQDLCGIARECVLCNRVVRGRQPLQEILEERNEQLDVAKKMHGFATEFCQHQIILCRSWSSLTSLV